jgi:hypothetical protein
MAMQTPSGSDNLFHFLNSLIVDKLSQRSTAGRRQFTKDAKDINPAVESR